MFTIGCDPELIFTNNNTPVPAHVPGTKDNPLHVDSGCIHPDNVTAEFSVDPANSAEEFSNSIDKLMGMINEMAARLGCIVSHQACASFDRMFLNNPEYNRAGCQPDYNAYTKEANKAPDYSITNKRAAGGHIHIGFKFENEDEVRRFIRILDRVITLPAIANGYEDEERRKYYGKAGAYRLKPYGVEYRTPSNWWVFTDETRKLVYSQIEDAIKLFIKGKDYDVSSIINNHDVEAAKVIVEGGYDGSL